MISKMASEPSSPSDTFSSICARLADIVVNGKIAGQSAAGFAE